MRGIRAPQTTTCRTSCSAEVCINHFNFINNLLRKLRYRGDSGHQQRCPQAVLAVQGCGVLRERVPGATLEGSGWAQSRVQVGVVEALCQYNSGHIKSYAIDQ